MTRLLQRWLGVAADKRVKWRRMRGGVLRKNSHIDKAVASLVAGPLESPTPAMKITIVLGAFLPVPTTMGGAVEKVWLSLAAEFARSGHEVVMISRAIGNLPREETMEGVVHRRVRGFDAPQILSG